MIFLTILLLQFASVCLFRFVGVQERTLGNATETLRFCRQLIGGFTSWRDSGTERTSAFGHALEASTIPLRSRFAVIGAKRESGHPAPGYLSFIDVSWKWAMSPAVDLH